MSLKIKRIIEDLSEEEVDIRILALTTIPRISADTKISREELQALTERVEAATASENPDVVFLARKARNCLGKFHPSAEDGAGAVEKGTGRDGDGAVGDGRSGSIESEEGREGPEAAQAGPRSGSDQPVPAAEPGGAAGGVAAAATSTMGAAVAMGPGEAGAPPAAAVEAAGSPSPDETGDGAGPVATDVTDDDEEAATVIRPPSGQTMDIERQLVTENDPRRLATLLAALTTDPAAKSILHRIVPFLQHDDDRVRANAVEVFENAGGSEHMQFLVPLLSDENNRVRSNVIKALAVFGHPQAKFHLAKMLRSKELSMRESAVYTLCQLKSIEMLDLLLEVLEDPYESIRLRAVKALSGFDLPEVVEALKNRLADDDEAVREAVIEALRAKGVNVASLVRKQVAAGSDPADELLDEKLEAALEAVSTAKTAAVDSMLEDLGPISDDDAVEAGETADRRGGDAPVATAAVGGGATPGRAGEAPASRDETHVVPAGSGTEEQPAETGQSVGDGAPAAEGGVPAADGGAAGAAVPSGGVPSRGDAGLPEDAGRLFHAVVKDISRELRQREQKARYTRLLFKVGIKAYELCRRGIVKEVALVVIYYEVVKYQEYLHKLSLKMAEASGENLEILQSGVEQYKNRIRDCFVKLGKLAAEHHQAGKVTLPPGKELDAIMKLMSS